MHTARSIRKKWWTMDHRPPTLKPVWIRLLWFLSFTTLNPAVSPQSGFISIDCGEGTTPYLDATNNIQWQPDGAFMKIGFTSIIKDPTLLGLGITSQALTTLRYFPDTEINKFCYDLGPVTIGQVYLVRASFLHGNYNGKNDNVYFDLLLEADFWDSIEVSNTSKIIQKEAYMVAERSNVTVCVARSTKIYTPFISSLEVRPISMHMNVAKSIIQNSLVVYLVRRYNFGAQTNADIRYPDDDYDRIWYAQTNNPKIATENLVPAISGDDPPSRVMQTAYDYSDNRSMSFTFGNLQIGTYFIMFHFAELNPSIREGNRVFNILIDGASWWNEIDVYSSFNGTFIGDWYYQSALKIKTSAMAVTLNATDSSLNGPIWNAFELYRFSDTLPTKRTLSDDVEALSSVQMSLGLSNWTGDPCLPLAYPYKWVNCSFQETTRVTALILPNRNLHGALPSNIHFLVELKEINFEHNSFTGNIPNWSALLKLRTLNLQYNNLSGPIPEFLGNLPNLLELSLQFNNFSGGLPASIQAKVSSSQLKIKNLLVELLK